MASSPPCTNSLPRIKRRAVPQRRVSPWGRMEISTEQPQVEDSINGTFAGLAAFTGPNGANPRGSLVSDGQGNLYGVAPQQGPSALGVIYRVTTNGEASTFVSFNQTNGASPQDGLLLGHDEASRFSSAVAEQRI